MSALPREFGIRVVVETMSPRYEIGDVAFCMPCRSTTAGKDYIIAARPGRRPSPGVEVSKPILRLVRVDRVTTTLLYARQYNPAKVRRLSRAKWQVAYLVTGKRCR